MVKEKTDLLEYIENLISTQVNRIRTEDSSPKNSMLYFGILLESKDLVDAILKMLKIFSQFKTVKK
jgi:hypothetical protein